MDPLFFKLVATLQDCYDIITHRSLHLKQTKEGSLFAFNFGDLYTGATVRQKAQWSLLVTLDHDSAEDHNYN